MCGLLTMVNGRAGVSRECPGSPTSSCYSPLSGPEVGGSNILPAAQWRRSLTLAPPDTGALQELPLEGPEGPKHMVVGQ